MSDYLTVTRLNQYIKSVVESDFSLMNIALLGEVTSLTKHYTGHFYFTLKDESSQIRCMMFSSYASKVDFDLKNGDQILVRGYIGVYDKGGTYQVYCRSMEPYGEGQYLLSLARLKEKLKVEGILDKEKKKLPFLPKRIALLSAKTGAAIHDFLSTVRSRINVEVYIFPCLVQGEEAASSVVKSLKECLNYHPDLVVITRGGGSKENLKAFNDEALVRFVADLEIPCIAAVGHRIDTTLLDYVSDLSCITPTDAANHAVPQRYELEEKIRFRMREATSAISMKQRRQMERLMALQRTLEAYSPSGRFEMLQMKITALNRRGDHATVLNLKNKEEKVKELARSVDRFGEKMIETRRMALKRLEDKILLLNPYRPLESGYGLIEGKSGVLTSVRDLKVKEKLTVRLKDGSIEAEILSVKEN